MGPDQCICPPGGIYLDAKCVGKVPAKINNSETFQQPACWIPKRVVQKFTATSLLHSSLGPEGWQGSLSHRVSYRGGGGGSYSPPVSLQDFFVMGVMS